MSHIQICSPNRSEARSLTLVSLEAGELPGGGSEAVPREGEVGRDDRGKGVRGGDASPGSATEQAQHPGEHRDEGMREVDDLRDHLGKPEEGELPGDRREKVPRAIQD